MPLFKCSKCGCIDNTAVTNYWKRYIHQDAMKLESKDDFNEKFPPLCSECDPKIGIWHDFFPKQSAVGMMIGDNGFLYKKEHVDKGMVNAHIVGVVE